MRVERAKNRIKIPDPDCINKKWLYNTHETWLCLQTNGPLLFIVYWVFIQAFILGALQTLSLILMHTHTHKTPKKAIITSIFHWRKLQSRKFKQLTHCYKLHLQKIWTSVWFKSLCLFQHFTYWRDQGILIKKRSSILVSMNTSIIRYYSGK